MGPLEAQQLSVHAIAELFQSAAAQAGIRAFLESRARRQAVRRADPAGVLQVGNREGRAEDREAENGSSGTSLPEVKAQHTE